MKLIVILAMLCVSVAAQSIGYSDPYNYTGKSERWVAKKKAKQERKHGAAIASAFEQNMHELSAFSEHLARMKAEIRAEFAACNDVSRMDRLSAVIVIEPAPFPVEGYSGTYSGVAYYDGRIRIVFFNVSSTAGPQMAVDLARGELRNWYWWRLRGYPREMWGVAACP